MRVAVFSMRMQEASNSTQVPETVVRNVEIDVMVSPVRVPVMSNVNVARQPGSTSEVPSQWLV
jgi:hypothetical protein